MRDDEHTLDVVYKITSDGLSKHPKQLSIR